MQKRVAGFYIQFNRRYSRTVLAAIVLFFHQQVKLIQAIQCRTIFLEIIGERFAKSDECQSAFMFDLIAQFFSAQPKFHRQESDAAHEHGDGDGLRVVMEFESLFIEHKTNRAGDDKCDGDFQHVVLHCLVAPVEKELMKAFVEEGNDGDDSAALDHDVEEIRLVAVQPILHQQQVARRGNGDKLGDSFDHTEDNGNNPIRHPGDKREFGEENKKKRVM